MVGTLSKIVLSTMRHIIFLRHSYHFSKHAVAMGNVMLRRLSVGLIAEDTCTSLLTSIILTD